MIPIVLEWSSAIFSMIGAYLASNGTKKNQEPVYYSFIAFIISNLFIVVFFIMEDKTYLAIQFLLFMFSCFFGFVKLDKNKRRALALISIPLFIISMFIFYHYESIHISSNDFIRIESLIAPITLIGNFFLSAERLLFRRFAFYLFLVVDCVFIYIGLTNGYYGFTLQSVFYIGTSIRGLYNLK
jgi:hypothetical protein